MFIFIRFKRLLNSRANIERNCTFFLYACFHFFQNIRISIIINTFVSKLFFPLISIFLFLNGLSIVSVKYTVKSKCVRIFLHWNYLSYKEETHRGIYRSYILVLIVLSLTGMCISKENQQNC